MKLILAADEKWAIGKDNGLLIHLPGDLAFFKEKTLEKTVVMGRKTLESLPGGKPLPNRRNVVITGNKDFQKENVLVLHSIEEVLELASGENSDDVFIIGGAEIYKQMLPYCDTMYITKIYADLPADRYFVNLDEMPELEIDWSSPVQEENGTKYQFFRYVRKDVPDGR